MNKQRKNVEFVTDESQFLTKEEHKEAHSGRQNTSMPKVHEKTEAIRPHNDTQGRLRAKPEKRFSRRR